MQPVSVIVPTLNEADNLEMLFKRIDSALTSSSIPYEIIVVDDYSTDGTAEKVTNANPKYNTRLLMKQGRPGKAFSLLEGFAAAEHTLVCMIDGDLQYPPEAIKLMYHKLQYCEADIVVTERIENQTSRLRRLTSYVFNLFFIRLLFGIHYDTQSGLKLFRKSVLKTISVDPSPWTFDLEFIVRALEQNYVIVSQRIPFSERNAGIPKVHLVRATIEIASNSLKLWRNTSTKRVKMNYRQLQRSLNLLLVIVGVTLVLTSLSTSRANALSWTPRGLYQAAQSAIDPSPQKPAQTTTPLTTSNPPQNQSPVASSTSSTTPTRTTADPSLSVSTNASSATSLTPATTVSRVSPIAAPQANPSSLTDSQGKNAKYYTASKLSARKTQSLLALAVEVVGLGAACILIGLLIAATKKLNARMHRQPLRI